MAQAATQNLSAYIRKMELNGYVLNVDLASVRELVSLQRRCANNLNQVAIYANTYGVYPSEIAALQKDYTELWGWVSEVLKQLTAVVELQGKRGALAQCRRSPLSLRVLIFSKSLLALFHQYFHQFVPFGL
ncbi:hypothetical protein D3C74_221660 [compost metagenome]